jgi:hypothetical protein
MEVAAPAQEVLEMYILNSYTYNNWYYSSIFN